MQNDKGFSLALAVSIENAVKGGHDPSTAENVARRVLLIMAQSAGYETAEEAPFTILSSPYVTPRKEVN